MYEKFLIGAGLLGNIVCLTVIGFNAGLMPVLAIVTVATIVAIGLWWASA